MKPQPLNNLTVTLKTAAVVLMLPAAGLLGWLMHMTCANLPSGWVWTGLALCVLGYTLYALHSRGLSRQVERSAGRVSTERALRQKAEWQQLQRETEFQLLYNHSPVMMHSIDEQGRFVNINEAWLEKTGYRREEILGRKLSMIHTEPSARKAEALAESFWKQGYVRDMTFQWRRRDGRVLYVEQDSNVVVDAQGRPISLSVIRDVTDQRRTEYHLRRSERERKLVLESISEGVLYISQDLRIMWGNDAAARMGGLADASRIVGHHCYEVIQGTDKPCRNCPCLQAMQTGRQVSLERTGRDGRVFMVNANPVRGRKGNIIGAVEIKSDITELKFAQERLQQFKTTLDLTLDSVFMFNPVNLRFFYVNAGATKMMGYTREELCHMTPLEIKPDFTEESFRRLIAPLQKRQQSSLTFQTRHQRADGTFLPVEVFLQYIAPPKRSGRFVAIVRDISAYKQAEARLEEALEELQRSNQDLEQFAYVASHDLQEPLRMVSSYVELLAHRYGEKLDEDAREYIQFATCGTKLMQELIQDLLAYSRIGTRGKPFERVELNDLVELVRTNIQELLREAGGTLEAGPLPTVTADRMQVVRLLQNLISNAVKFRGDRPPHVRVSAERQADGWALRVEDNGIGIDPKHYERIFTVFQRLHTRDQYPGTGMGLAICKRIVERHGGTIGVRSRPGEGTCFTFTIPDHEVNHDEFQVDASGGDSARRGQSCGRPADLRGVAGEPPREPPARRPRWRGGDGVPQTPESLRPQPPAGPDPAGPEPAP